MILSLAKIFFTVISLTVNVPVLSVQIMVVEPNVSTLGSLLIREFLFSILWVPRAREIGTTAGNPSGMAATARETETISISLQGMRWTIKPALKTIIAITIVM